MDAQDKQHKASKSSVLSLRETYHFLQESLFMRVLLLVQISVFAFAGPAFGQIDVDVVSESIVRVRAYRYNKVAAEGTGFVVNATGDVLTNAHLLKNADRVTVLSLKTGAEIVAQEVFASREMNLALLRVQGLGSPPLSLSEQGADVGRVVETLTFTAGDSVRIARGTIGAHQDVPGRTAADSIVHLLQHNAIVKSRAFGMPVFNECGKVIGINLPDPDSGRWPFRNVKEPRGTVFALRSGNIVAVLGNEEIAHTVVDDACLTAIERAEAREDSLRRAQARTDSLARARAREDSLRKAQARADSLSQAREDSIRTAAEERMRAERGSLERAQARTDSVKRAREDSLRRAHGRADSLARARADSIRSAAADRLETTKDSLAAVQNQEREEASERFRWTVVAGAAFVILLLLGWFLFARSKKAQMQSSSSRASEAEREAEAARQAAARARQPAPFRCLLEGQDDTGRPFVLSIPALALPPGVALGRSPANSEFIIDHEAVSREHVRLTVTDGRLYAEDLNSTNGTTINARLVSPGELAVLENNDELAMGPVVFRVRLMPE